MYLLLLTDTINKCSQSPTTTKTTKDRVVLFVKDESLDDPKEVFGQARKRGIKINKFSNNVFFFHNEN